MGGKEIIITNVDENNHFSLSFAFYHRAKLVPYILVPLIIVNNARWQQQKVLNERKIRVFPRKRR